MTDIKRRKKTATRKAVALEHAEARLEQSRFRLDLVLTKIDRAVAGGRIVPSRQLERAVQRAVGHLEEAERSLGGLTLEQTPSWEARHGEAQARLEDLAVSIQQLLARAT